jgi:hypothetical protein
VKLNTDASFIGLGKPSAAGAVANGKILMAACSPLPNCGDCKRSGREDLLGYPSPPCVFPYIEDI